MLKARCRKRKGISDLIATMLLLAMTAVAGFALFGFVRNQAGISELSYAQSTSATPISGENCTVAFAGALDSLQMVSQGAWKLDSSSCGVTSQSGGITSDTLTGNFTSDVSRGIVSGTWSMDGNAQSFVASSTGFALSVSADQGVGQAPLLGSAFQGMLSGAGIQGMLAVGTTGQITLK